MNQEQHGPVPTEIDLQQRSRVLNIRFENGTKFTLPCRYLRLYSPSAEVRAARNRGEKIVAPTDVTINKIEPVGSYAVRLIFSDGHETGVYSWATLYQLGRDMTKNWPPADASAVTSADASTVPDTDFSQWRPIQVYYFGSLVEQLERNHEEVQIPPSVQTVQGLIDWLAKRSAYWDTALKRNPVKVTINRQFAEPDSEIAGGDEVAFVPEVPGG